MKVGLLAANTAPSRRAVGVGWLVSMAIVIGGPIGYVGGTLAGAHVSWQVILGGIDLVALEFGLLSNGTLRKDRVPCARPSTA